ncbi:MAG: hypothetical protein WCH44_07945, partial [Betaproteobacteria bacterium]
RLELLAPRGANPVRDWRLELFDLALRSPPGQLAPLRQRSAFLARRLGLAACACAGVALVGALGAAAGRWQGALDAQVQREQVQRELAKIGAEIDQAQRSVADQGVPAPLLRRALGLEDRELAQAPSLTDAMAAVSGVLGRQPQWRLARFDWRLLASGEPACAAGASASASANASANASAAGQRAEIKLELAPQPSLSMREFAQTQTQLSSDLARLDGIALLQDPSRQAADKALSSEATAAGEAAVWCLSRNTVGAGAFP